MGLFRSSVPFAANENLNAALGLHLLQRVAARADELADEVDARELFDRDEHLAGQHPQHENGVSQYESSWHGRIVLQHQAAPYTFWR